MAYQHNDGGKAGAGFKGNGDCGIRAVAIALELPYNDSRKLLKEYAKKGKQGNGQISRGIYKEDMDAALRSRDWIWRSAPKFTGRKARYQDIPRGRVIVRMAKHYAVVIDGVLLDAWNSSEKMVYGYWEKG